MSIARIVYTIIQVARATKTARQDVALFNAAGMCKNSKERRGSGVVFQAVLVGGAAGVFAEGVGEVALR